MKVQVYSAKGVSKGSQELPKNLLADENLYLLAQAVRVYENRNHPGTHKVKTRAEVSLTGAKMYRQKGTGNARHGSFKAPIFSGGGIAHGPTGVKHFLTLPQKMREKALHIALSLKAKDANLILVDNLISLAKTNEAQKLIDTIVEKEFEAKKPAKVSIILALENIRLGRFFRNIANCHIYIYDYLNAYNITIGGLILLDSQALEKNTNKNDLEDRVEKAVNLNKVKSESKNKKTTVKKVANKNIKKVGTTRKVKSK